MMSKVSDKVIAALREIYKEPGARAFFDWAAARERDATETRIAVISDRTGMADFEARDLVQRLEGLGCCEFVVGRRGHPSRVRWEYSLRGLGIAARGDANSLEKVDRESLEFDVEVEAEQPLTIPEAKRRLAATLGIEPSAIEISVKA